MNILPLLANLPLFRGLPEAEVRAMALGGALRRFAPGAIVAAEGDTVRAFRLVVRGRVKLSKTSPEGREQTLYVFSPGEFFCLCSAFFGEPFPADASALNEAEVFILPGERLEALGRGHPELLLNLLRFLSGRLTDSMLLVESLSLREIHERLAAFLLHLPHGGDDGWVELGMTHRELAKIIGATPEALSRAFRRLSSAGLTEVRGRKVRLADPAGLARLAEADDPAA